MARLVRGAHPRGRAVELLLDTHALIWSIERPEELPRPAYAAIEDGANIVYVSSISVYESALKATIGKIEIQADLAVEAERIGFEPLPLTWEHAQVAGTLPLHHRDPFDRLLVAQALVERLTLVTRDERLGRYGVAILAA